MQLLSCCVPATCVAVGVGLVVVLLRVVVVFERFRVSLRACVLLSGFRCALCRDLVTLVDCRGFCGFTMVSPVCFAVVRGCLFGLL